MNLIKILKKECLYESFKFYTDMGYNREQIECTYKETDKNESNCKM